MMKRVGFMFAGQGAQYVGMGHDIANESEAAAAVFSKADQLLQQDLSNLCFKGPVERLVASANCQPAIYTVSLACLAAFQEKCDIKPHVCGGLSLGEFAALTAAGTLNFSNGLQLMAKRGALMDKACQETDGAMAAVLSAEQSKIQSACEIADVDVANYNCPGQIVISGERKKVEHALELLKAEGVNRVVMLQVAGAYHSRLMKTAAAEFGSALTRIRLKTPECAVAQNVVGDLVTDPGDIKENLELQVTGSVRWEDCVQAMLETGIEAIIEFGPGKVLSGFMRRIDRKFPTFNVDTAEDLNRVVNEFA